MSYNFDHHPGETGKIWVVLAAVLVLLAWVLALAISAAGSRQ
jgi:hypothetical protein